MQNAHEGCEERARTNQLPSTTLPDSAVAVLSTSPSKLNPTRQKPFHPTSGGTNTETNRLFCRTTLRHQRSPPSCLPKLLDAGPECSLVSQLLHRQGFPTNTLAENRPQGWPKPTRPGTDRTEKIIMLRAGCKPKAAIFGFHPPSTSRWTPPTGTQYRQAARSPPTCHHCDSRISPSSQHTSFSPRR